MWINLRACGNYSPYLVRLLMTLTSRFGAFVGRRLHGHRKTRIDGDRFSLHAEALEVTIEANKARIHLTFSISRTWPIRLIASSKFDATSENSDRRKG